MRELTRGEAIPRGAVVLLQGPTGTAYQRFYSDALFHGVSGKTYTYNEIFNQVHKPLLVHPLSD